MSELNFNILESHRVILGRDSFGLTSICLCIVHDSRSGGENVDNYIRNSAVNQYSDAVKSSRDLACRVKASSGCSQGKTE